ncbi:phospholipase B1, membrane-associated-like [Oscarella lobularis]|uniref:phospholipase B1, membrane-associated-like n=1 Tax=Oscarella lobularis TaxID=121494 RepID=UPI00331398DA
MLPVFFTLLRVWVVSLFIVKGGSMPSPVGVNFQCPSLSPSSTIPTSVRKLRPSDIKVIGAMGNSVTAGAVIRATNPFNLTQIRDDVGLSWSIGGDYGDASVAGTLGNILRFYNEDLRGMSRGSCPLFEAGKANCPNDGFNGAISGSQARDLLNQAKHIVQEMRSDTMINVKTDWKIITLWIGGNDLCKYCYTDKSKGGTTAQEYHDAIKESLDYLKANLPRTFVNLVITVDVTKIARRLTGTVVCDLTIFRETLCSCYKSAGATSEEAIHNLAEEFQDKLRILAASRDYNDRDDFVVVLQPFFENFLQNFPANERLSDYFAADCFHFGVRGQALLATSLWNNMFEPIGNKSKDGSWDLTVKCPKLPYYLATKERVNSTATSNAAAANSGRFVAVAMWAGITLILLAYDFS